MIATSETQKTVLARELGVSRSTLYYKPKKPDKDWSIKCEIEEVLRIHPSYGSPRVSLTLKRNHKQVERVMHAFGIKAYRRRGKRWKKTKNTKVVYPNLLLTTHPQYENHIWATDFTYIWFQGRFIYVATVIDLYTRKIVGLAVYTTHSVPLVLSALMAALHGNSRPFIFHSDNGSEYDSEVFVGALNTVGVHLSRSAPGCPWENGYQESFYNQFKIDLGDPSRFKTLGELVFAIYQTIYAYNHTRIHTALKMSPSEFAHAHTHVTLHTCKVRVRRTGGGPSYASIDASNAVSIIFPLGSVYLTGLFLP
jgi:transposase InsO family protein